jgi:hypothetical protein
MKVFFTAQNLKGCTPRVKIFQWSVVFYDTPARATQKKKNTLTAAPRQTVQKMPICRADAAALQFQKWLPTFLAGAALNK